MRTMKTSSCLLRLPFHNTAMALCQRQDNQPSSSLARRCRTFLCWGGWGDNDDDNDNPRGNDDAYCDQPHPPNTQQPAIAGGEGGNDEEDKEESEVGKGR